ncbi:MAG: DUF58 domain-containing protein [Candidatus Omnitrophica bacterium]|nr:DUF58 domain-containing protein [Candidatus Omnitrophota bacterium]
MIPKEVLRNIRRIEITTSRLVTDVFAGAYHSVFKGRGMEFDEVREYQPGDDIRTIDWNVTARTGKPYIKKFVEEREMTVMLLVDVSRSCQFATVNELKSKLAAEIAAVLAFSAIRNSDKVGLIIFTDGVEKFIPPRKGLRHVLRVIREVLYYEPKGFKTDICQALEYLSKVTTRKSVSFLISDFFEDNLVTRLKKDLAIANKRHDLIAVTLNDPRERNLPDCGILELEDAETQEVFSVDSTSAQIRERYCKDAQERILKREELFRSVGMDFINVSTDVPYVHELTKFFIKRKRRFR